MNIKEAIAQLRPALIESTRRLVQLKSVRGPGQPGMPFGAEASRCLRAALALAEKLGFAVRDFDGYIGEAETGEGDQAIGILGHLDVVPEGSGWDYPPYGAALAEGRIYGRGAMDDKGPILAAMYGVKALQMAGVPFHKRVRVIFGLDEESGMQCIEHYLTHRKPPDCSFTPDGVFPAIYGEKGVFNLALAADVPNVGRLGDGAAFTLESIHGGDRVNMVPDACEAIFACPKQPPSPQAALTGVRYSLEQIEQGRWALRCFGKPSHGSMPECGANAVLGAFHYLKQLCLSGPLGQMAGFYTQVFSDVYGQALGCQMREAFCGPLTVNVGVIQYRGSRLQLQVDFRYPIGHKIAEITDVIEPLFAAHGWRCAVTKHMPPMYVDPNGELVTNLMKAYWDVTGYRGHAPATISGGTYARKLPNAVAFGPIFPGQAEVGHRPNEFISVDHLLQLTEIYAHAVLELLA